MIHFRNPTNQEVHGYDPTTQQELIDQAIANNWAPVPVWPLPPSDQQLTQRCKQQALSLLKETDWSVFQDVIDPAINPHLINQDAFVAYRSILRGYVINPVADPEWPVRPTPQWST